ncbi:hypothetical protein BH11GEM2_BH11GEM2_13600 [soil metagenome]
MRRLGDAGGVFIFVVLSFVVLFRSSLSQCATGNDLSRPLFAMARRRNYGPPNEPDALNNRNEKKTKPPFDVACRFCP